MPRIRQGQPQLQNEMTHPAKIRPDGPPFKKEAVPQSETAPLDAMNLLHGQHGRVGDSLLLARLSETGGNGRLASRGPASDTTEADGRDIGSRRRPRHLGSQINRGAVTKFTRGLECEGGTFRDCRSYGADREAGDRSRGHGQVRGAGDTGKHCIDGGRSGTDARRDALPTASVTDGSNGWRGRRPINARAQVNGLLAGRARSGKRYADPDVRGGICRCQSDRRDGSRSDGHGRGTLNPLIGRSNVRGSR